MLFSTYWIQPSACYLEQAEDIFLFNKWKLNLINSETVEVIYKEVHYQHYTASKWMFILHMKRIGADSSKRFKFQTFMTQ